MKKNLSQAALFLGAVLMFASCSKKEKHETKADNGSVLSILYQQQAAEYRALCLQAYNLAKLRVDEALRSDRDPKHKAHKHWAVITDLDETALDNSQFEALAFEDDTTASFPMLQNWWLQEKAKDVPGAVEFFKYLKSKDVDIYYISNRTSSPAYINATRINMRNLGFPYTDTTDNDHFKFQTDASSKESRRLEVTAKDSVIVYLGDNLIDLDKAFDQYKGKYLPSDIRRHKVDSIKYMWGDKYIVFPNAIYGDWESTFYQKYKDNHNNQAPSMKLKRYIRKCLLQIP